ncbi:ATP-dependent DNA ligase [Rhodococcus sp. NPDC057014]|uniref:ATP-dependent DNA ligase n=1 Tax=Rhodococcus sp. NPDC057014 TaxID=3346000 RepID=UPI00362C7B30
MRLIAPMLATAGPPPDDERPWSFEMKFDGCRILASVGGGRDPKLWTRNLNVVTGSYPEVAEALAVAFGSAEPIVLDGEIVALDRGKPSFNLLQRRMAVAHATKPLQKRIPVTYLPFDLLVTSGESIMTASYLDRRAELATLDAALKDIGGLPITVPPHWESQSGRIMLNAARSAGQEGVVGKRSTSIYLPGQRSRAWVKTAIRLRRAIVAAGFVGSSRSVAAVILGAYDAESRLVPVGVVSSGLTMAMRRQLREDFRKLERPASPFAEQGPPPAEAHPSGVRWLDPVITLAIEYREYTGHGELRHPSLKGQVFDTDPGSVRVEDL